MEELLDDESFVPENNKSSSDESLDFHPKNTNLDEIPEEFDWRGNPIEKKDLDLDSGDQVQDPNSAAAKKKRLLKQQLQRKVADKIRNNLMKRKGGAGGAGGSAAEPAYTTMVDEDELRR